MFVLFEALRGTNSREKGTGVKMARGLPMADWNGLVLFEIKKQLGDFNEQGFLPTLRGMYYTLVDLGVIPKTEPHIMLSAIILQDGERNGYCHGIVLQTIREISYRILTTAM